MQRADQNLLLTKRRPLKELFKGRVLPSERVHLDRTMNNDIQEFGAHFTGAGSDEAGWYARKLRSKSNSLNGLGCELSP